MPSWIPLFRELARIRGDNSTSSVFADSLNCFMVTSLERIDSFRTVTSQKYREWSSHFNVKAIVATATFLGLVVAIANLPPALQTKDLARWTAMKDFREYCASEETNNHTISPECQSALNRPLHAPPTGRSLKDFQSKPPSQVIKYRLSPRKVHILQRFWRAGMVALVITVIVCFSILYLTGRMRRVRTETWIATDPESVIGFTRKTITHHRTTSFDSAGRTAFPSNVSAKAAPTILRSRKRFAVQGNGGKSPVLEDFESRVLDAERRKAGARFEGTEDSNLFCTDGKFFSMTLKTIAPREPALLKRSPII